MVNYVLDTTGNSIDIIDALLAEDFTFEVSFSLSDGVVPTSVTTLFSGAGVALDFSDDMLQLTANRSAIVSADTAAASGEWINAAVVRDAGTVRLYIDGQLVDTSATAWVSPMAVTELDAGFEGRLDGIQLWSVARDAQQIENGALGFVDISTGAPARLERYYRFDDDLEHIVDATGNAGRDHDLHTPAGATIVEDATVPAADNQGAIGFIDTKVADGLFLATSMEFLPDGRMIVSQQNGVITIIKGPTQINSPTATYLDLSSETLVMVESGMLSLAVDPDFDTNGYIYAFYTDAKTNKSTMSRFVHQENSGGATGRTDPASETVLWRETDVFSDGHHQGGGTLAIAYEPIDANAPSPYKFYITTGEEFEGANSQDLTHDDGKVHRLNLTDGSIPTDNPYYDAATAVQYNTPLGSTRVLQFPPAPKICPLMQKV